MRLKDSELALGRLGTKETRRDHCGIEHSDGVGVCG